MSPRGKVRTWIFFLILASLLFWHPQSCLSSSSSSHHYCFGDDVSLVPHLINKHHLRLEQHRGGVLRSASRSRWYTRALHAAHEVFDRRSWLFPWLALTTVDDRSVRLLLRYTVSYGGLDDLLGLQLCQLSAVHRMIC
jgi:hypothetical protein